MEKEKVVIVLLNVNSKYNEEQLEYKIEELKELVRASLGEVLFTVTQNAPSINSKFYIGQGKAEEIRDLCKNHEIDTVIFNHELSGSQMKNLEDIIEAKIVDRTGLILDIFARRARTKESKLQVKLAQLEYRLPRLVGYRNYLSREGAGIGTRGPGEQKLEIDRRSIQREITAIKNQLKNEKTRRDIKRKQRISSSLPIISLVGYSNSGKSTLLNKMGEFNQNLDKEVYSDDLLFATLDTSSRVIKLRNDKEILVTDTVGFISDLPTKLIESFKSTLEEIKDSDLLVMVIDSSNPSYQLQIDATNEVLKELEISKDVLYVFNKMDKNPDFIDYNEFENELYISALDLEDIDKTLSKIQELLYSNYMYMDVFIPYNKYDELKNLVPIDKKSEEIFDETGVNTTIYFDKEYINKYIKYKRNWGNDGPRVKKRIQDNSWS